MDYAQHLNPNATPQSEPLNARQVPNSAGGHAFPVDDWTRLERFLILGAEGGSYYAGERKLTRENAACVDRLLKVDGQRVVRVIAEVSDAGRAPKNDPAIFALALCLKTGDVATRQAAALAVPKVCRTGTHLFALAEATKGLSAVKVEGGIQHWGWGPVLRRAFAHWYMGMDPDRLALQLVKYRQRDGWTHRDVLRRARPIGGRANDLLHYAAKGWPSIGEEPHPDPVLRRVWAFERAQHEKSPARLAALITDHRLPRECVPTEALAHREVWEALLGAGGGMPMTALIRQLGKMTQVGLLAPLSDATAKVCAMLRDTERLVRSRIHPLKVLIAQRAYAGGKGRSGLVWTADQQILAALEDAFYLAFKAVTPTGKRRLLALDVSASMSGGEVAGSSLTPREASCAMALVTANTEEQTHMMAFSCGFIPLEGIGRGSRLGDAVARTAALPFNRTDCALPMVWATRERVKVDAFEVYTDSETWAGNVHPTVALEAYRQKMGIPAKLIVVGMVSNGFSIADPTDAGMMDVVGFDTAAPAVMADFIRGGAAAANEDEADEAA